MAVKVNAGEVTRAEVLAIFPEHILHDDATNTRAEPHSEEQIEALARSILEQGQLQACLARKVADNRVQLVAGFGRVKAVEYINKHLNPEKPLKVLVRIVDMNAEEAFVKSLAENLQRHNTTPIDDAENQRKLREVYHWPETKIAELYQKSVSYIGQLRKVLTLSEGIKEEVSSGNLPVTTAIIVAEVAEEVREDIIAEARQEDGKISTEVVRRRVREKKTNTPNATNTPARTLKEIKSFFEGLTGNAEPKEVQLLAGLMLRFLGTVKPITDEQMEAALKAILEGRVKSK